MLAILELALQLLDSRANANVGTHPNLELRANGYRKQMEEVMKKRRVLQDCNGL